MGATRSNAVHSIALDLKKPKYGGQLSRPSKRHVTASCFDLIAGRPMTTPTFLVTHLIVR
jgi:hypothetical protein